MPDKKVVTIDDRIPALKEQRRKRSNRRLIMYLSIFFILILLVVYFQSSLSHVQNIEVAGTQHVPTEQVREASGIEKGTSMWSVKIGQAEEKVTELIEVDEVSVKRSLPTTVRIEVVEHERMAYVESGEQYIPVLKNGTVLSHNMTDTLPEDAPLLKNFEDEETLTAFTKELSQLGEGILNRISEVILFTKEDETELHLYMTDGIEVRSTIHQFARNMSSYPSISQEIDPNTPGILHMKMSPYFEAIEKEPVESSSEDEERMEAYE